VVLAVALVSAAVVLVARWTSVRTQPQAAGELLEAS
jgi:hypothetical protein